MISISRLQSRIFTIFLVCFLSACSTSLDKLQLIDISEPSFNNYLAKNYLSFAETEALQYDWSDSKYFANKGLKAASGHDTPPEKIVHWSISDNYKHLKKARNQLVNLINDQQILEQSPQKLANAQFYFDCWLEEQEEAWQIDAINDCKSNFYKTLSSITGNKLQKVTANKTIKKQQSLFLKQKTFTISFDINTPSVTPNQQLILQSVATIAKKQKDYSLVLNGYSDKSGDVHYNLKLSKQRANHVSTRLTELGIDEHNIEIFAYGENAPDANNQHRRAVDIILYY